MKHPYDRNKTRTSLGRFASTLQPLTPEAINKLIAGATRLAVPAALKREWRGWPMERRGEFISRLRKKLRLPTDRPNTPFSSNVEPFDYTSPRANQIMNRKNAGRGSKYFAVKMDIKSQGVIYRDELWFWSHKTGYQLGPWTPERGRPCLHHHIWRETHGRPVPAGMVLVFKDGNRNNLSPDNLAPATKNDICRQNQAAALTRSSRERTALLLKIHHKGTRHANNIKQIKGV
jgi:hypothetical protein